MPKRLFIFSLISLAILAAVSVGVYITNSYGSVSEFGPLKLGTPAPIKPGDQTSYPYREIPQSKFYVYAVQKGLPTDCVFEECGMSGTIVDCMGGWLSGNQQPETADRFGLNIEEVATGESSIIVVADKNSQIVGIYPNRTTHNLPTILKKHPDLSEHLNWCLNYHLPK